MVNESSKFDIGKLHPTLHHPLQPKNLYFIHLEILIFSKKKTCKQSSNTFTRKVKHTFRYPGAIRICFASQ